MMQSDAAYFNAGRVNGVCNKALRGAWAISLSCNHSRLLKHNHFSFRFPEKKITDFGLYTYFALIETERGRSNPIKTGLKGMGRPTGIAGAALHRRC
jgi:hypothetical protein